LFSSTTATNSLVETYRSLKYETPTAALLFAAATGAAVQAKGNFLKYKGTFVSSCTEKNIIGNCVHEQSSCLSEHRDFHTAKPIPNNLFSF
jgi:hypothetical protein